jgi:hypothetical protein
VRNHTVASTCTGDLDADLDVDGADLAEWIKDSGIPGLSFLAAGFGRNDCP